MKEIVDNLREKIDNAKSYKELIFVMNETYDIYDECEKQLEDGFNSGRISLNRFIIDRKRLVNSFLKITRYIRERSMIGFAD